MAERRKAGLPATIVAGGIIGAVAAVLAISFAALVFGGGDRRLHRRGHQPVPRRGRADARGLRVARAAPAAWSAGLQPASALVLAIVSATIAVTAFGSVERAFLTVVAATLVVTVLCGVAFLALGAFRSGNLLRFVPVPVVGGFIAGVGWLLLKSGIYVSSDESAYLTPIAICCTAIC